MRRQKRDWRAHLTEHERNDLAVMDALLAEAKKEVRRLSRDRILIQNRATVRSIRGEKTA